MKQFVIRLITTLFPLFIFLLSVNFLGDAANLFNSYEDKIISILKEGKFVTNISNYNERLFQEKFILSLTDTPSLVVIGSSRTRSVNSDMFKSEALINNSVSGASIQDVLAIFQIYMKSNRLPKKIIISIDPWMFNDNSGQSRWKSLSNYYFDFKKEPNTSRRNLNIFKELLSFSYFQNSLPRLFERNRFPVATENRINSTNTMLLDGSNVKSLEIINSTEKMVNDKVNAYLNNKSIYGLSDFSVISNNSLSDLNLFLDELFKQNIECSFFLSPYHPKVYKRIKSDYPLVLDLENSIREISSNRGIKIYGSYNPKDLNMDKFDFFDGMHCLEHGIIKIIEK